MIPENLLHELAVVSIFMLHNEKVNYKAVVISEGEDNTNKLIPYSLECPYSKLGIW